MIHGLDVSNHQGRIDWDKAAVGQSFAICKASEGNSFIDRWLVRNWTELGRLGLVRGAYHYARPGDNTPEAEARHFLSVMSNVEIAPGDLAVLDLEEGADDFDVIGWSLRWLEIVTNALGFRPMLYSYQWYIQVRNFDQAPGIAQYPLWYASYRATWPPTPAPWVSMPIWQYTSTLAVDGITGPCDANRSKLTVDELRALGKPDPAMTDDERMEAHWQANAESYGEKRYAGTLTRDWYTGKVLRAERALITPDGRNLLQSNAGNILDDWEQDQERQGTLVRHVTP